MKTAGIICEYNPFHKGHACHIAETKRLLGDACGVFCVMSGNFTQRGDFAIMDKFSRAEAAVLSGADLVAELPLPWVVSSAEGFARGGVGLLASSGICTHISFGSECGDIGRLTAAADILMSGQFTEKLRELLQSGIPYAAAIQRAAEAIDKESGAVLSGPNNILGIEYIKALRTLGSTITPICVKRAGAGHDAPPLPGELASAAYLRGLDPDNPQFIENVPESALEIYREEYRSGRAPMLMQNCEQGILSRLRAMDEADYAALPDSSEGLYLRFMKYAKQDPDIQSVLEHTKTKRYPMSRVRRMLLCACLGIKAVDIPAAPPYLRVLAFNDRGRQLLGEIKGKSELPVISRSADVKALDPASRRVFELEAAASDLRNLASPEICWRSAGQEWRKSPKYLHIR